MPAFDYTRIPVGYYDQVMHSGHPIRRCWHRQKFERVLAALPTGKNLSVLDIGCFAGTFLTLLPPDWFSRQLGVDILPDQIEWAARHYGTPYREFRAIGTLDELRSFSECFDCITLIEVIEHLEAAEIENLFASIRKISRPGSALVITTPNYHSAWPALERILNRVSDVSYEEQHLSKFTFFGFEKRLERIVPGLFEEFRLDLKTTSHFISPFLALCSEKLAMRASRTLSPRRWRFPFGNLILARFVRTC